MQSRRQQNLDKCRASCQRIRNTIGPAIWLYVAGAVVWVSLVVALCLMCARWCFLVFCWLDPQTEDGQLATVVIGIGSFVFIMSAIGYAIERKRAGR